MGTNIPLEVLSTIYYVFILFYIPPGPYLTNAFKKFIR